MTDYKELSQKYGIPFYLFDIDEVKNRINGIKNHLPQNAKLCYAIKANAFLLDFLKEEDLLFEVCSPGELAICQSKNVNPSKIVFSGVCKSYEDVKAAYNLKVNTITLESKTHLNHLLKVLDTEKVHNQDVIIRLTSGNQFGMSSNDVNECVELIKNQPSLNLRGIHFFTGTQKKLKKITEEIAFIENFCNQLQSSFNISFNSIEYGPGLSYEYFSQENQSENFCELIEFSKLIENSKYNYVIELGRYIASSCGTYATKIMDVKGDGKATYCIIDGGINHINYYGQMMGMKNPKIDHIQNTSSESQTVNCTIAGSLCTTADIVLRNLPLKNPQQDDLLVFKDIGAYSITEGIYLFLSHPLPSVIAKTENSIAILRDSKETYILNS